MVTTFLGYHRISRIGDRPDTPVSEGEAEKRIRALAKHLGARVKMLPTEKDQTGGRMERPILAGAVEAVERREYAGILVVQYDRLSRAHLVDALRVIQRVEQAGGAVRSAAESFDTSTPEGRMGRDVFLSMAHMQLDRQKLYIRASKRRAVEQGIWPTNTIPLGYTCTRRKHGGDGKLHPDPVDAGRVVAGVEARASGKSWRQVADVMVVGMTSAAKIVRNRVYLGEIRLRARDATGELTEEWVNPDAHEPLVSRDLFDRAQLDHPRPPRGKHPPALLQGLVFCAACGHNMTPSSARRGGHVERVYRCVGKPLADGKVCRAHTSISQRKLDPYVEAIALSEIARGQAIAADRTTEIGELEQQLADAEREWAAYRATVKVTEAGAEAWKAGDDTRAERAADLRARLAEAKLAVGPLPDARLVEDLWPDLSVEERRHVLRGALGAVWVWKGNGPCPGRVRIVAAGHGPPARGWRRRREPLTVGWEDDFPGELRPPAAEHVA